MGKEQELSVLAYLVKRPELMYEFGLGQLDEIHFEYKQAQILYKLLRQIFDRHREMPTLQEFLWRIQSHAALRELPVLTRIHLEKCADVIYTLPVSETTGDYILSFIIGRESTKAQDLLEGLRDAGHVDVLPDKILEIENKLEKMRQLASRDKQEGVSMPFEDESLEDVGAYVMEGYGGEPIAYDIPLLDHNTRGGAHRGELQLFVGATGVGKTVLATSIAASYLRRGYSVCNFALDNSIGDLRTRYLSSVTGIPVDLDQSLREWALRVQEKSVSLRDRRLQLYIKHFPARSVSIKDLRVAERRAEDEMSRRASRRGESFEGFDLKIIDYVDLLNPDGRPSKEKRHDLQDITQKAMGWAQDTKSVVLALSQTNVGGLTNDVVTLENMSEAYSKSWPAALVGCICQTEAEYQEGLARLAFPKNRNGPKNFIVPVEMNYRNYRVKQRDGIEEAYKIHSKISRPVDPRERKKTKVDHTREYSGPTG